MQEAIRRLESQLAGESSRMGEVGGWGVHCGSPKVHLVVAMYLVTHVLQAARVDVVCDVVVEVVVVIDDLGC